MMSRILNTLYKNRASPAGRAESAGPGPLPPQQAPATLLTGKRVLIMDTDLYHQVGGGQTAYRKLIEASPENTYFYFRHEEMVDAPRPINARAILLRDHYQPNSAGLPRETELFYHDYLMAWQMAASVRSEFGACDFDVVDTPDYRTLGLFIRCAFAAHGIGVGTVALALHGTLSSALRDQWPRTTAPRSWLAGARIREHLQFRNADVRYALSATYAREWTNYTRLPVRQIDPLRFVGNISPICFDETPTLPDLFFIGRRERRKGPDLFLDLAWALDPGTYRSLVFIGGDSISAAGVGSQHILQEMAALRGMRVEFRAPLPSAGLDELFAARSIVILPSRYDQFNLICLEALRKGCPVFVSKRAGVSCWIQTHYPQLAHLILDVDCSRSGSRAIRAALADYNGFRHHLINTLMSVPMSGCHDEFSEMYEPLGPVDRSARRTVAEIGYRLDALSPPLDSEDIRVNQSVKRLAKAWHKWRAWWEN